MECDGNQIQQVMLVLMVNASEAMPEGGKLVSDHGIRCRDRTGCGAGEGHGPGHPGRRCCRTFSIRSSPPRKISTAPVWGWP